MTMSASDRPVARRFRGAQLRGARRVRHGGDDPVDYLDVLDDALAHLEAGLSL
jgi:hypothetical protein